MKSNSLSKKKIMIVVHEALPVGPTFDLRRYLLDHSVERLLHISHPLIYLKEFYKKSSYYEYYKRGRLVERKSAFHWRMPDVLLYVKDFLYSVYLCLARNEKYDLYVGADPLNAIAGIALKRLGRVEKVIYHSIDYFTRRFENKILNKIYHTVDKICVRFSDETWNLSSMMMNARQAYNNIDPETSRQVTVPVGVWFKKVKRKPFNRIHKKKVVFIGSFVPMMGIDLILKAVPFIVKAVPEAKFEFIGSGPSDQILRGIAKKLKLDKHVTFHGWVYDRKKLGEILSDGAIGLAPFNTTILDDQVRNADPAKLKDYMLWGMPVIVSDAISNAKKIDEARCGIVIGYKLEELVDAVVQLLQNEKLLREYRKNAIKFVKKFDNEKIFKENLGRVLGEKL